MTQEIDRRSVLSGAAVVGGVAAATLLSGTGRAVAAVGGDAGDPYGVSGRWAYALSVDGVRTAVFSVLVELTLEVRPAQDVATVGLGAVRTSTPVVVPPIVRLSRPLSDSLDLSAWHELARTGQVSARRSCSLEVIDYEGRQAAKYELVNAWPTRLETALSDGADPVLTETVTLTADRVTRVV